MFNDRDLDDMMGYMITNGKVDSNFGLIDEDDFEDKLDDDDDFEDELDDDDDFEDKLDDDFDNYYGRKVRRRK